MHSFPFAGHLKDNFGKEYLLNSTNAIIFDFPGDRRQTRFYFNTIFGTESKIATYAMEYGKYGKYDNMLK